MALWRTVIGKKIVMAITGLALIGFVIAHMHENLKSKIHRAKVTGGNVQYEGSLTIDEDFMDKVGLVPFEKILCSNMANAARFETYAIPGMRGSKQIVLNGAAAHPGARAKTISDFETHSPSPRPSPSGWERENRAPRDCGSNRFGSFKRWVWLFPLPSDGRGSC